MADVDNPYKAAVSPTQTVPAYDIVNDYDWTSSPAGSDLRKETPCAYIRAYKMEFSQLQQFIDGFINIATAETKAKKLGSDPGLQFYKDLYSSSKVMADINFPFFSDSIRGFASEYADTFSAISQRGSQFLFGEGINNLGNAAIGSIGGAIAGARELGNLGGNGISEAVAGGANAVGQFAGRGFEKLTGLKMPGFQTVGAPGSFIETPKFYQYSNTDEGVEIAFVLSNTLNDFRSNKGFRQNIKFIKEFTMMNRPYREGAIAMTFPAIYHIEIPGLRYIEWAYLENFGIELMGTRRRIGKDIIPEAYMCKFIFKSLTIEAANFVEQTNQVEAFDEGDSSYVALRRQSDTAAEARQAAEREEQRKRKEAAARQEEIEQKRKDKEVKRQLESPAVGDNTSITRPDGTLQNTPPQIPNVDGDPVILPIDATFRGRIPADPSQRSPEQQALAEQNPSLVEGNFDSTVSGVERDYIEKPKQQILNNLKPGAEPIFDTRSPVNMDVVERESAQRTQDLQMANRQFRPSGMTPNEFDRAKREAQTRLDEYDKFYADQEERKRAEASRRRSEIADQSDEQVRANERAAERREQAERAASEKAKREKELQEAQRRIQMENVGGGANEPIEGTLGFIP